MTNATICLMANKTYSTLEAAEKSGVHRATLMRWLKAGRVKASDERKMPGGRILRWWTDADIKMLEDYKDAHYWEMPQARRGKKK
jgi:transposase